MGNSQSENAQFKCDNTLTNYSCELCDFETDLKIILNTHMQHDCQETNFNVSNYVCNNCNFTSLSVLVWYIHQRNCDKQQKLDNLNINFLRCKFCEYKSSTHIGLKEHYSNYHANEMYKCNQCPFTTTKKSYIRKHCRLRHSERKLVHLECQHCPYKTIYKGDLKTHIILRHTRPEDIKWFECTQCNYKGKTKYSLRSHVKIHSGRTNKRTYDTLDNRLEDTSGEKSLIFNCIFCQYKFSAQKGLKDHYINHHPDEIYKCNQCSFTTTRKCYLNKHCRARHSEHKRVHLECQHCPYKTFYRIVLKRHIIFRHTRPEDIKWFECTQCKYKGKTKYALRIHVKEMHSGRTNTRTYVALDNRLKGTSGEKSLLFNCIFCHYKFSAQKDLKDHHINHHPDEIYKCNQCSYITPRELYIKRHYWKHHSGREIVYIECEFQNCSYKTPSKTDMKTHILLKHTRPEDIKWFECTQCNYKGKTNCALRNHVRDMHSGKPKTKTYVSLKKTSG